MLIERDLAAAFAGRRVLITGGAGFIAGHLCDALLHIGAEVSLIGGRSAEPHDTLWPAGGHPNPTSYELRVGSDQFRHFLGAEAPFAFIFHLGGRASAAGSVQQPALDYAANLAATYDLLEQLRHTKAPSRLIFASSAAVYGTPECLPIRDQDATVPISPYGVSKLAAERYVAVYARLYGISAASLRLFSVFGPGQRKQVVYDLFCKLHRSPKQLVVIGDGTQVRDMVYVEDAVRAFLMVAARGRPDGYAYNVASGIGISTRELAQAIIAVQGAKARLRFTERTRPGDPDCFVGSCEALAALGAKPRHTLAEGLRATAEWFNAVVAAQEERAV